MITAKQAMELSIVRDQNLCNNSLPILMKKFREIEKSVRKAIEDGRNRAYFDLIGEKKLDESIYKDLKKLGYTVHKSTIYPSISWNLSFWQKINNWIFPND